MWRKGIRKASEVPKKDKSKLVKLSFDAKKSVKCRKEGKLLCPKTGRCRMPENIADCYKKSGVYYVKKKGKSPKLLLGKKSKDYATLNQAIRYIQKNPGYSVFYKGKKKRQMMD